MPFRYEEIRTPKGTPCLCVRVSGHVTLQEAEGLGARLKAGGDYNGGIVMSVVEKGTEYTTEARKYFPTLQPYYRGFATVVTNPIVRTMINMMLRVQGDARSFRLFTSEAEALAWLDGLDARAP